MKKLIQRTFLILLFSSFSLNNQATSSTPNYSELIIQIPTVDVDRGLPQLKTDLLALGGIQIIDYCKNLKCLSIRIDRNLHADNISLDSLMASKNILFDIKMGVTIAELKTQCSDITNDSRAR